MSPRIPHPNPKLHRGPCVIGHCGFRGLLRIVACLALVVLALSSADAQTGAAPIGGRSEQHIPSMDVPPVVDGTLNMQMRRIRALNIERQKALVSDTDELLKLTMQLNAEVARDRSSSLSPEQVRMVAKIEKLAKSVREKMSDPVQRNIFENSFPPSMGPPVPFR